MSERGSTKDALKRLQMANLALEVVAERLDDIADAIDSRKQMTGGFARTTAERCRRAALGLGFTLSDPTQPPSQVKGKE